MAKIVDLEKKYLGRAFVNGGGYTTKEYESFQTKYINYLKSLCRENGWTLVKINKGHYEFSAFIQDQNQNYVYFSISDVRYWQDQWYNRILIRGARDANDYRGGQNQYTDLPDAQKNIQKIFDYMLQWKLL